MRFVVRGFLAVALLLLARAPAAFANCATDDPTGAKVLAARQAANSMCPCATAANHGAYVKCVAGVANMRSSGTNPSLPPSCKGAVKKCAAHSTCGKPGSVTCCLTTIAGTKCKVKKDAAHCPATGTIGNCTSCCDACPAPGSGPSCPTTTTTTTLPSCGATNACGGPCPSGTTCLFDNQLGVSGGCACVDCTASGAACACVASHPPPSCDAGPCSATDTCVTNVCGDGPDWCFGPKCASDGDCPGGEVCSFLQCPLCILPGGSCTPGGLGCCNGLACAGGICPGPP